MELHRPAALPRPTAGLVELGKCIRAHGVSDFPDPTFSGSEVHDSGIQSSSPQLQSAMEACRDAVRRWPWRVTGNCRTEAEKATDGT